MENVVNPDPSTREDSMEGRMDLVQAVVVDQGFITKRSSAIMAQMAPQLLKDLKQNSAVLQGQADVQNPRVSQDQTGTQKQTLPVVSYDQTGSKEQSNPIVSYDRSGAATKRGRNACNTAR